MNPGGYTVEVTGLSPKATEKDILDFFAFSGAIELVEIVRSGEDACTAYVSFKDAYSQETACLLSGATIVDQRVCITRWGHFDEEFDFWSRPSGYHEEDGTPASAQRSQFASTTGTAVSMAQDVVKTMLAMGYVLGKDTFTKAKAFDESHQGMKRLKPWMRSTTYCRQPNLLYQPLEEQLLLLLIRWSGVATSPGELFSFLMP
ncbi:binding partner of ACD11 1-like isoform X2 [Cucurbita maxima]|uniref:Binding partner of ACD11 1-like isoform X2 n=1 Tax=Cucurbita maxima TaxID=3661 RepID=A0A6J1HT94_CUCMA|nr:binding partner of ACD11 1-like isoform X2 [Cucurbita maxima]